jgi:hypothetical protein
MDMLTDIYTTKRNITTLHEQTKQIIEIQQHEIQRLRQLQETVSQLTIQIQKLLVDVSVLKAKSLGFGPTF